MHYSELLDRMRERDPEAFLEMTDRYGWAVYQTIRRKYPDRETADRIYRDTMNAFYLAVQDPRCEDPLEGLLCALSDRVTPEAEPVSPVTAGEEVPGELPEISASEETADRPEQTQRRRKRSGLWSFLGSALVMAGIFLMLWIILGLLMSMKLIPWADLGYTWFNANIAHWF